MKTCTLAPLITAAMGAGAIIRVSKDDLDGKTGVIFFKDYWQRGSESFEARSGDPIDLWNKDQIASSGMLMRSVMEFFGALSDLNKSREIWFWEVR